MKRYLCLLFAFLSFLFFMPTATAKTLPFGDVSFGNQVDLTDAKLVFTYLQGNESFTSAQSTAAEDFSALSILAI